MRARLLASVASLIVANAAVAFAGGSARADASEATPHEDDAFDFMNVLSHRGLHDLRDEPWNAYGQFTYISSWKLPFAAPYTNFNHSNGSLITERERSFTASFTLYLGAHLWPGGEAYFVPEVIALRPLSGLHGLGGAIQNFELQKTGSETPQLYRSRLYFQQTIGLGGDRVKKSSDPMQLGTTVDARRLVLRIGNFSTIDFFDKNTFAGDLRRQFFNMAFLTYAAYDFEADARGYGFGGVAELFFDQWSVRVARMTPPRDPNSLSLDLRLYKYFGDQVELEHDHVLFGQAGAIRVLGYRNVANMGRFDDAIAAHDGDPTRNAAACDTYHLYNYGSANTSAPDLCWARKTNTKVGLGVNVEQHLTEDLGVFFRGMISDGKSEVYAFTSTDRSISFGALAKGSLWRRPLDVTGVGVGMGWISSAHAEYLRQGGVDGFIGDGNIRPAVESVFEVFYSANVLNAFWLSVDYQRITHPAFNADRGHVDVFGARGHAEF